eukprot:966681-Prymnesium_polylepis.1
MRVNQGRGVALVDGDGGAALGRSGSGSGPEPPYLFLANDARRVPGARPNARFGSNGAMFATRDVAPADLATA